MKPHFDIKECLDEKNKTVNLLNRNYFFVTTVFIVLLNIIVYAVHGSATKYFIDSYPHWGEFSVSNLFQALVNSYTHSNWQHCLLNMLCFFIAGLYLERKKGSLKFLLFMAIMSLFTAFATCTNDLTLYWQGFSAVNFGLYGYIIIEYVFVLCQKEKRNLFNIISGVVVLGLIYFAMCFSGGTVRVTFEWYPYDLLHNLGHASGFVTGLVFGVYEQACSVISKFKNNKITKN
ncbi:MAG: rhomboid family intramembrane serine protease [Clostridia bacterium]|nr:rhomboid family intramembrane serine protease [Clostridia bacterium]